MSPDASTDLTDDGVLGGRLRLLQPRHGHRVGHDAILLAAAVRLASGELAADLGAGVGAAGLALAWRCAGSKVRLVEIDPGLAALAAENAARNGLAERVSAHALDVLAPSSTFTAGGLADESCDTVLMNPPFNDPTRAQASPDLLRRAAHMADAGTLPGWIATAHRLLRPGGVLTLIHRADAQPQVVAALAAEFDGIAVLPVHPKPAAAAIRILVRAAKGGGATRGRWAAKSRAAGPVLPAILPGLVLNGPDGRPTAEAEAVLRSAGELPLARWGES